jgi:hypothetical protein
VESPNRWAMLRIAGEVLLRKCALKQDHHERSCDKCLQEVFGWIDLHITFICENINRRMACEAANSRLLPPATFSANLTRILR